ncbi:trefoil factor 1 [Manis pentadactyla]|uniref:trefoil factor 1 n=1 Tax=Manis pentadactyla TaxID=143292 RepID=UPI001875B094|nr:trefoil factor 1 [Manis pentadactyla]KAI5182025.1 Trefoil Factor 1 [Manis pentadactyla]
MESKAICVLAMVVALALSTLAQGRDESCTVAPRERANCGYSGITPAVCKAKGCCFDNTVSGVPWCFRPMSTNKAPEEEECLF